MKNYHGNAQWARVCYGVDLQAGVATIVRGERTGGRLDFSRVTRQDSGFIDAQRKDAVCVGCLSGRESFTRWLQAPFPSLSKVRKVLPTLLDVQLPFPLEDCVYGFLDVARGEGNTTQALSVAARLSDVRQKLAALSELGFDPPILDQAGLALWTQGLEARPAAGDGRRVVVHIGADEVMLALGCGERFVGAHAMQAADHAAIKRLLRAQFGSAPEGETEWLWAGPAVQDATTFPALSAALLQDWPGPSTLVDDPGTFLARALVTRALLPGPLRCNLRIGPLMHERLVKRRVRLRIGAALLGLLAGLVLCIVNLSVQHTVRKREAVADRVFGAVADNLAGYHLAARGEHAVRTVRDAVERRTGLLRPFADAFEPSLAEVLATVTGLAQRHDLRLASCSLSRDAVSVRGTAGGWQSCDELARYLAERGYEATLAREDADADGRIPFSIASVKRDE